MANTLKFGNGEWYGKKDTILAYNDENSNYKPLPFNFSRASKATVINKDGLIEEVGSGQPRIDYKDDSEGALLLEPSRTNFLTYSEDFSNNSYTKTNVTVTSGFLAPNGSTNATKLVSSAVNGQLLFGGGSGNTNTKSVSVFAKANTSTSKFKIIEQYYSGHQTLFDLNLGVVEFNNSVGSKIEDYGNGWYKCTHIQSYTSGQTNATFAFRTNTPESLFIWGAQLEVGSYATSYIPTQGSTVTRVADACNNGGNEQVINSTEGVLYAEISGLSQSNSNYYITIGQNTINGILGISFYTGNNRILFDYWVAGVETYHIESISDITQFNKIAVCYNGTSIKGYINGVSVWNTTVTAFAVNAISELNFNYSGGNAFYGNVKDVRVYNEALTDQELIALTQV